MGAGAGRSASRRCTATTGSTTCCSRPTAPGVCAVDWQTLSLALPARDLAYVVATSLPVAERRRARGRRWSRRTTSALTGYGVTDYPLEAAWDDYRFAMLQGPLVAVLGCVYGTRTDRGDAMFAAMVRRTCAAIRDHGSLTLVG